MKTDPSAKANTNAGRLPGVLGAHALFTALALCAATSGHASFREAAGNPSSALRTEKNEVIRTNFPDPNMMRRGNDFIIVGTSTMDGYLRLAHSTDLIHWNQIGHVFPHDAPPSWVDPDSPHVWSGHILFHEESGLYYCFYSGLRKERPVSGHGHAIAVATAPGIHGPWEDHGPFYQGGGINGSQLGDGSVIDAFIFFDEGKPHMFFQEEDHGRWLGMCALTDDLLSVRPETLKMVYKTPPEWTSWENGVAEGNTVIKRDGRYVLLYSGSNYAYGAGYAVGVLTAPKITGPWEPFPGNPVLHSNRHVNAPGIVKSIMRMDDGAWWSLYHGYLNDRGLSYWRTTFLDRVEWGDDGMPQFAGLRSFQETRPTAARENRVMFGDFACGPSNPAPWVLLGDASLIGVCPGIFNARLVTGPEAGISRISQVVPGLPAGEYLLEINLVTSNCNGRVRVECDGAVQADRPLPPAPSPVTVAISFAKNASFAIPAVITVETAPGAPMGEIVLGSVSLVPTFTCQLEAEHGVGTGWQRRLRSESASAGFYCHSMHYPGQEVHFPAARIPESGRHHATLRYIADTAATLNLHVNGALAGTLALPPSDSPGRFTEQRFAIDLAGGDNLLALKREAGNTGAVSVDALFIRRPDPAMEAVELDHPGPVPRVFRFSRDYFEDPRRWSHRHRDAESSGSQWHIMACRGNNTLENLELLPSLFYAHPNDYWCRGNVSWVHPGENHDIAVVWVAPEAGTIDYWCPLLPNLPNMQSDGTRVRVMKNQEQIWPEKGWEHVPMSGWTPIDTLKASGVRVRQGDRIYLQINKGGHAHGDALRVDPYIAFYE